MLTLSFGKWVVYKSLCLVNIFLCVNMCTSCLITCSFQSFNCSITSERAKVKVISCSLTKAMFAMIWWVFQVLLCYNFYYFLIRTLWVEVCVEDVAVWWEILMLLVRILLSTLHSLNLWTGLPISAIAWGQARSKLGGVDTSKKHHYFI